MFLGAAGALMVGPVSAAPDAAQSAADTTTGKSLDGLRLPDRPAAPALIPTAHRRAATEPRAPITVKPGDSLWSIAARGLGGGATISQINTATQQWYAVNRAQIGSDPNLILPGQKLITPTKDSS
jgi:nucleoid-associated protein YgaU